MRERLIGQPGVPKSIADRLEQTTAVSFFRVRRTPEERA